MLLDTRRRTRIADQYGDVPLGLPISLENLPPAASGHSPLAAVARGERFRSGLCGVSVAVCVGEQATDSLSPFKWCFS